MSPLLVVAAIINGSFETGDYTGWKLTKQAADPSFATIGMLRTGEALAMYGMLHDYADRVDVREFSNGLPMTGAPTDGTWQAIELQNGPATTRLEQTFVVPDDAQTLAFDIACHNWADRFADDQRLAVELRDPTSDTVLATLFTASGDLVQPMTHYEADLTSYRGAAVVLVVDLVAHRGLLDAGFDRFELVAATQPPGDGTDTHGDGGGCSATGGGTGCDALGVLLGVIAARRRRR